MGIAEYKCDGITLILLKVIFKMLKVCDSGLQNKPPWLLANNDFCIQLKGVHYKGVWEMI